MKNWRNLLMLIAFLGFCVWYGGTYAYRTQFVEPRKKLREDIKKAEDTKAMFEESISKEESALQQLALQDLYRRSLPTGNAATLYHSWLIEAGNNCLFEDLSVVSRGVQQTRYNYYVVRFQLDARTSLDDLSRFLYEFYWVPYLHKITYLEILPVENADLIDISMQIEGLSLLRFPDNATPFPLHDRLPDGYWRRLSSGLLETYTEPIDKRNLLQFSRGGIDASDRARLTAIVHIGGEPEFWIHSELENRTIHVQLKEQFRIGSFIGQIVEVFGGDVVLETAGTSSRPAMRWVLSQGEYLNKAIAVGNEY